MDQNFSYLIWKVAFRWWKEADAAMIELKQLRFKTSASFSKFDRSVAVNLKPISHFFGVYDTCCLLKKSLDFVKLSSDG